MADITLKLVWFKLGEKYTDICEKYYHFLDWYEDFAWSRVDFLDMLFLGWLLAAFVVVGAINLYLRFFGHPKQSTKSESRGGISPQDGETAQWLNCLLSWLQKHYQNTPEFVEAWIRALNEQTRKHTGDYQIKVDKVQERSPAPKITRISTESSTQDYITLKVDVEAQETVLLVSAIQQSSTSVRVTNCDVAVQQLKGQLKVHLQLNTDEIQINICFATTPELKLQVRPKQIDSQVNIKTVEDVVQNALCSSVTSLVIPTKGGYPQYLGGIKPGSFMQERTQRQSSQTPSSSLQAASPSGSLQNRRLLVKVIKANGLGDKEFACTGPYCTVQLDEPRQKNTTSVVKNTVNPFWDEHFIFDLSDESTEIKFEVFDREKPPGIDFLGRAVIAMGELKRMPSSRQIIPLTGKPGATTTSGSVTVEFMFMEVESQKTTLAKQPEAENVSPRRRIETNRTVMPGGTVVTTKTTVTEKPRDHKMDFGYTESPSKVEKSETSSNYTGDYSPYSSRASSHLGAHEAGLTASQELTNGMTDSLTEHVLKSLSREREMREANRQSRASSKSSVTTVTITGVQQLREPVIPIIKTPDQRSLNGSSMDQPLPSPSDNKDAFIAEVKKSKSFADTLKRKFKRKPKSSRSQSVDRASSMKEHDLLRPPDQSSRCSESDYESEQIPEAGLQKNRSRSRSFSSSLKRLFKGKKKEPKEGRPSSRESSVSRQSARSATGALTVSREGTSNPQSQSCRDDFPYSTSVPAQTSPLFDQYNSH